MVRQVVQNAEMLQDEVRRRQSLIKQRSTGTRLKSHRNRHSEAHAHLVTLSA